MLRGDADRIPLAPGAHPAGPGTGAVNGNHGAEPSTPVVHGKARRANDLDGREWTRHSISVWSDIRRTPEEAALKHPAMFPAALVERLVRCFTRDHGAVVLDPFAGSGSTLVAAVGLGRQAVGFEVNPAYRQLAGERLQALGAEDRWALHPRSARELPAVVPEGSVDLCVTSPPYWNILAQRRSADGKETRDYAPAEDDLSRIESYEGFIEALGEVFGGVYRVLKPGGYCVVNVMDLRKQSRFYPFHSDLAARLTDAGRGGEFILDDLIIWDRRADYNNLRPLGYPYVFRVNKVHEFLIILRRPREEPAAPASG